MGVQMNNSGVDWVCLTQQHAINVKENKSNLELIS